MRGLYQSLLATISKKMIKKIFLLVSLILIIVGLISFNVNKQYDDEIINYIVDLNKYDLKLYWKDDDGNTFRSIENLKDCLDKKKIKLVFAMNGGMYKQDNSPQGFFIKEEKELSPLDTTSGNGNFYLKPNGVFFITTANKALICESTRFVNKGDIKYATQSGPMLVIDGLIHPMFKQGSTNLNIRNGVGVLPNNEVVFAMSKQKINFYDFANYFKTLGCKQALYLDGFVSRTYLPEKNWIQTDGNFGVIIGVAEQ